MDFEWINEMFRTHTPREEGGLGGGTIGGAFIGMWAAELPSLQLFGIPVPIGQYLGAYLTGREDLSSLTPGETGYARSEVYEQDASGQFRLVRVGPPVPGLEPGVLDFTGSPLKARDAAKPNAQRSDGSTWLDGPNGGGRNERRQNLRDPNLLADNTDHKIIVEGWSSSPVRGELDIGGRPELKYYRIEWGPTTYTPAPAPIDEVIVRGVRPDRSPPFRGVPSGVPPGFVPPGSVPSLEMRSNVLTPRGSPSGREFRPETEYVPQDERSFWDRGGTGLVVGGLVAAGGFLLISNPVGWVALGAAFAASAGLAAVETSSIQLFDSYARGASPDQDARANQGTNALLGLSSPAGFAGSVIGTLWTGDEEGMGAGAFWFGMVEGVASLGTGAGRIAMREWRFGPTRPNMSWKAVGPINQRAFKLVPRRVPTRPNPLFPRNTERIELSHWIPKNPTSGSWSRIRQSLGDQRYWALVNRPWNLEPMWGLDHALVDPQRFQLLKPSAMKASLESQQWQGLPRLVRLTPPSILKSSYGAARIGVSVVADRGSPGRLTSLSPLMAIDFDMPTGPLSSESLDDADADTFIPDND